ncbi:MAG: hypothetical protein CMB57_06920 [Euryarchaeota archaeon]|nr:hypothetical protein [Euryarchaeota archaeon]|tara:strand:- start:4491 stop:6473 length:1983 start_codon:yes stop_codon:yes gene_type:complete
MQRRLSTALIALLLLTAMPLSVSADETKDIPTNATETGNHNSLVAALAHAGLVDTLSGVGPFTVFAPTDQAFTDAGIDLADFNTEEANQTLVDILTYHVVSGEVLSSALTDGMSVETLNGDNITIGVGDNVTVNDATVTLADVVSSNGVIHVIDKVLLPPVDGPGDIPTIASNTGVHDVLVDAIIQAGLLDSLSDVGPYTIFAPTDQAFTDAGIDLADFSGDDGIAALGNVLAYHVTMGTVMSGDLSDGQLVTMLNQQQVRVGVTPGGVIVNDASVTQADVVASNGVIHVIDKVLMPPEIVEGEICYNSVTHTIVPGADQATCEGYMYLNNTEMDGQNYTGCYNTVTHQITEVSEAVCAAYIWTAAVDIATTAAATSIHTSLVAALGVAGLVDTLSGDDNYTVFAPTDDAFAAAGINLADYDTDEEISALADILLYHVVAGEIASTDLADGANAVTAANGDELIVTVAEGTVTVGAEGATVVLADVPASNGVIHVIDKVILPPADEPTEPEEPEVVCAATIGITSDGYGFTPASTTIAVGETVCWKWTNESMAHNVKEVAGLKSTTYVENGVYSGASAKTVDFHHTFTEDTTFYYACEPHIGMEMFGKVIVGDGGAEPAVVDEDKDDKKDNNTPGFLGLTAILATLGAVLVARKRQENEL